MQFLTLATTSLLAALAAAESSNINFYTGGDCSGTDKTMEIPLDSTCQQAPQGFGSYDPKDLKANCGVYSDNACKNAVKESEKGATTCQQLQGGTGMSISCSEQSPLK